MVNSLLAFLTSVLLLLFSTEIFVKMAQKISLALRISPLIVGITIVAVGTSLPELAVSFIAALKNDTGLALGNIIGSNITNIFLVLPAGILLGTIHVGTVKTQRNSFLLLLSTFLFVLITMVFRFSSATTGFILLFSALLFTVSQYIWGVHGRNNEDYQKLKGNIKLRLGFKDLILFLASLAGILAGGSILVESVKKLSLITGLSTTVLGLSLTAVATSMPEFLTTIFSLKNNEEKMALGNIVGSNIYNLLLIGGVIGLATPIITMPRWEWIILLAATIFFTSLIFIYKGKVIPKRYGYLFLILFLIYIWSLTLG